MFLMKVFLVVIAFCYCTCQSQGQNWILVDYETQVSYLRCWTEYHESCFWFIVMICSRQKVDKCVVDFKKEIRSKRTCKDGWANLPDCLTPICLSCRNGEICTGPDKCDCLITRGVCTNVPCSDIKSCFPGTCSPSKICVCNPNFYGDDCQNIRRTPTNLICELTLDTATQKDMKTTCAPPNNEPEIKWINSINKLSLRLESTYDSTGLNLPDSTVATYAKFPVSIGVSNLNYSITLASATGSTKSVFSGSCPGYSVDSAVPHATCDINKAYQDTGMQSPSLNDTFQVQVFSNLGGYIEGVNNPKILFSSFPRKTFFGDKVNTSVMLKVDDTPPVHCLGSNTDCPFFPIYLENDVTTEKTVYPKFLGWTDSASGIARYHVEIYLLGASTARLLENIGSPTQVLDIKSTENTVAITCTTPGVYSIELTVYDQVNNNASARNIFICSDSAGIKTNPDKPLKVKDAVKSEVNKNEWWINDTSKLISKTITFSWDGYCSSSGQFREEWTYPVKPWNKGIDDTVYNGRSYGPRTIDEYKGLKEGIYSYIISTYIGPKIGMQYKQTEAYNSSVNSANIGFTSLSDGTTVAVQFSCADMSGGKITEELFINVDTSPATVSEVTFQKNYPDTYTSSVNLRIEEKESGIKSINYNIFMGSNSNNPLISQSIAPQIRDAPSTNNRKKKREVLEGPCMAGDKSCYCTPMGHCYNYYQSVPIDHCLIDKVNNNDFYFKVTVTNLAGITSTPRGIRMTDMTDVECRPANKLTAGQIAAIVICVLILIAILVVITFLLIRIYYFKKSAPRVITQTYSRREDGPVSTENELYHVGDDSREERDFNQDDYIHSSEYTRLTKIPANSINLYEELSKGKMIMVNKATFNNNGNQEIVAVKYLKNGSSAKTKKSFQEKINFLSDLTPHENIVKFMGICENPQRTMMVLEYCELTLKSWLSSLGNVTPDILDDMCMISLNVANGVEHLHKKKIVHKRLLAKNVLLTKRFSQWVAKLIGFGPDKCEDEADRKTLVPIKWLAPETLETINDSHPTYNEKTDAWTYGILLWEIYTKALSLPYPEMSSSEAMKFIIIGETMPMPENCPGFICENILFKCWSTNPEERPNFSKISSEIEAFRNSAYDDTTGYYAPGGVH